MPDVSGMSSWAEAKIRCGWWWPRSQTLNPILSPNATPDSAARNEGK